MNFKKGDNIKCGQAIDSFLNGVFKGIPETEDYGNDVFESLKKLKNCVLEKKKYLNAKREQIIEKIQKDISAADNNSEGYNTANFRADVLNLYLTAWKTFLCCYRKLGGELAVNAIHEYIIPLIETRTKCSITYEASSKVFNLKPADTSLKRNSLWTSIKHKLGITANV